MNSRPLSVRARLALTAHERHQYNKLYQKKQTPVKYILRAGTKIDRSKSRTALPGMPWGWEKFTTTRDAFFVSDDLITSKSNGMVVVRIPGSGGGVRTDGWQSIQFEFLLLGVV